ncbi:MAG TPA: sulfite exporter TauE/SafE family protein [Kofleriaceae bacterium]|nr:sulfite exporter TauE/SafE family protein [Kofleriaceae bacterium]
MTDAVLLVLAVTSLVAATVNGALGYGYSSISVPVALLVVAGRILNPALVIVEVGINLYALWWNRGSARAVLPRVAPLSVGLVPGVIVGALLLGTVAPGDAKLVVYSVLLPLILIQASGRRWPIRNERRASVPLGGGVGLLYGLTTISGPPLALFWNNQGLEKNDFKVALAIVRSIESICALAAYAYLGLLTAKSVAILPWIIPGVLIGFPIGHWLVKHIGVETFRRVCMSFDAYLVSFGLARTLTAFGIDPAFAYQAMLVTALVDGRLLWQFFRSAASNATRRTERLEVTA